jgi:hypothetical protein
MTLPEAVLQLSPGSARAAAARRFALRPLAALLVCAVVLLAGCNLERASNRPLTPAITPGSARPVVAILSPANNSEVVVGAQVLVSATASDSVGVSRVQLFANGASVKTISSESAAGDRTVSAILDYTPRSTGPVTLSVVAYRGSVASDTAQITVNVRQAQAQVTATLPVNPGIPNINPNDPTCRVLANGTVNFRQSPDSSVTTNIVTTLAPGTVVPVVGRLANNTWWQVRVNTTVGWVAAQVVTLYGNCQLVPVVSAPVAPTIAAPTFTWTPIILPTNTLTLTPVPPTLTPTPGTPDLIISSIAGPTALTLGPGNSVVVANFSVQITNSGQGPAGAFSSVISVSPGTPETPLGVVSGLGAGQSTILTITLPFTTPGTYTVAARADSNGQVAELSDVNNTGQVTVTISPSA